jgi:hypothetical protein
MAKDISVGTFAAVLFFVLYLWRLGSIVPGLSPHEQAARAASGTFKNIIDDPINAPHKVIQLLLQVLGYHGAFWMRAVSVLFALIFLVSLFFVLRVWFGKYIATAGILLFGSTPWVVLTARNAAPDIMMLSPILLIAAYTLLARTQKMITAVWLLFIVSLAVCVYTPGVIWFLVFALIIGNKRITKTILRPESFTAVMGFAALILLIAPLGYAFVQNTDLAKELLALPQSMPGIFEALKNTVWSVSSLIYQIHQPTELALGKFAILSIIQVVLSTAGAFSLGKISKLRLAWILVLLAISIIITGINNNLIFLTLGLPSIAVLNASGLKYLYSKWFSVFPINPLARWFAIIIIGLVLIAQLAYGVRYAVFAWPHNVETRKIYMVK